jgi:uncharacterized delta-60 repeat protein
VVVLGQSGSGPALIRFDAGGTIDAGFGTVVPPGSTGMLPFGLVEQADGKLVVVAVNYQTCAMLVARYDAGGAPDAGFGDGGVVTRSFAGNDFYGLYAFMGLLELPDGKLLIGLASAVGDGLREQGVLLRLEADGAADESYAPDGVVELAIGSGSTSVNALALDGEGRLVAAGRTWTRSGGSDFMALRFQP